jgi:hypothetical protein
MPINVDTIYAPDLSTRLMADLDAVNNRWGAGTLEYAASGLTKVWQTQCHRRSPAYTTNWAELPVAHEWWAMLLVLF